jgi:hypothetical protein
MKKTCFLLGTLAFMLTVSPLPTASAQSTALQPAGREVSEQYRPNLGGEAGYFTDWERTGLTGFRNLSGSGSFFKPV